MHFVPGDSGPLYAETGLGPAWLVEPWNTVSNAAFLLVFFYWWFNAPRTGPAVRLFKFGLPVLFAGWVGGTLYHGWRSSDFYYLLDYIPIYVLTIALSIHLWGRLGHLMLGALLISLGLAFLVGEAFWGSHSPMMYTLCYVTLGAMAVIPMVMLAYKSGRQEPRLLLGCLTFAAALGCRLMDSEVSVYLAHGSHFLWHIFGATSVHLALTYVAAVPVLES